MSLPFLLLPFAVPRLGGSIRASRERKAARASGTEGSGRQLGRSGGWRSPWLLHSRRERGSLPVPLAVYVFDESVSRDVRRRVTTSPLRPMAKMMTTRRRRSSVTQTGVGRLPDLRVQPNVKAKPSAPPSRNSIANRRSTIGPCCRTSWCIRCWVRTPDPS
jgi:hypothetical protein